jgi:circadian clock protein KaiC
MSEPHNKLAQHLGEFAFFDPEFLGSRVEYINMSDFLAPSRQDGLEAMTSEIVRKTLDEEPSIVVVDSIKMLDDFGDRRELRRKLYDLTGRFARTDTVLLLLGEYTAGELDSEVVFALADGIIQLDYEAREPLDRRWLRVIKMRGTNSRSGKHIIRIGPRGVELFPRIETLFTRLEAPLLAQIPSGIPGLDDLMGGGARQSDASLVAGPSGIGKTIFSLRWIAQGIEQGRNCLFVTFQDTPAQLTSVAASFGWDLAAYHDSGQLAISYVPMGDLDLDVLASSIRAEVGRHRVGRVVIDSLSELASAARERDRFAAYLRSLIGLIRAEGASLLLTSETSLHGQPDNTLDELLFLFDNTIELRYIEEGAQVGRAVHIGKMRSRAHAMTLNRLTITDRGLEVGPAIDNVTGRLGWSALRTLEPSEQATPAT